MKKNKNVVCMLAMASIIAPSVASIDFNETNVAYASDSVEKIVKYVTQGNGGGDGSQGNPYQGIEEAINSAPEGAILKLTSNVSVQNERAINFKKNLTIDGQGSYELGLRGSAFELKSDFTFKNLKLAITRDGSNVPKIYANGYKLEFYNVNTKLSDGQPNERPELYGGSNSGESSGSKSTIIIKGDNIESKFAKIYARGSSGRSDIPVDITVDSSNTNVLNGMDLSNVGAEVNVVNKSRNIKTFTGDQNGSISISFEKKEGEDKLEIDNVNLTNIQNITLKDSKLRLTGNPGHVNNLNLTDKKSEL